MHVLGRPLGIVLLGFSYFLVGFRCSMFGDRVESRNSDEREEIRGSSNRSSLKLLLPPLLICWEHWWVSISIFHFYFFFYLLLYRLWMAFHGDCFVYIWFHASQLVIVMDMFLYWGTLFSLYVGYDIPMHRACLCCFRALFRWLYSLIAQLRSISIMWSLICAEVVYGEA